MPQCDCYREIKADLRNARMREAWYVREIEMGDPDNMANFWKRSAIGWRRFSVITQQRHNRYHISW